MKKGKKKNFKMLKENCNIILGLKLNYKLIKNFFIF